MCKVGMFIASRLGENYRMQRYSVGQIPRWAALPMDWVSLGIDTRQVEISHQDLIAGCPPILS